MKVELLDVELEAGATGLVLLGTLLGAAAAGSAALRV